MKSCFGHSNFEFVSNFEFRASNLLRGLTGYGGMMRTLLIILVLSTCCLAQSRPPNIIHIVADDVGYDDLGCYGAPKIKTPNIDRLAAEGVRFTNFYAPAPTCTPTRAALMTGCYAQRVGLPKVLFPNDNVGLSDREITIAELLKERGYATACIGKWHLGHATQFLPNHHGFDLYFGIPYPNDHGPERAKSNNQAAPFPPIPLFRNDQIIEQPALLKTLPDRIGDEAISFITANKQQPFFLHLANIETHTPWFVPDHCADKSAEGAYGDAVQCFDHLVGRVMETLAALKLESETLVVITSDNGPLWKRHPELEKIYGKYGTVDPSRPHVLQGGKYQVKLEGGTRVACIARWPGTIPAGRTCDELAAGFDLFTTFATAGGAIVPADRIIDGKDIMPLMRDANAKSPHEYFWYYQNNQLAAVRDAAGWKLTLDDQPELFNVRTDPGESKKLAAAHPKIVKRLQNAAEAARKDLGDARTKTDGANRRAAGVVEGS